jgi:hypothetical protein
MTFGYSSSGQRKRDASCVASRSIELYCVESWLVGASQTPLFLR